MNTLPTLYESYQQLLLDISIYGRVKSVPQRNLTEIKENFFEEFKLSRPYPTLEDERYKLSSLVSSDYKITYDNELFELADKESLFDYSSEREIEVDDTLENISMEENNLKSLFTYENSVTDAERERILEKYDLKSGELLDIGVSQTEAIFNTVQEDKSLILSDDEIENLGREDMSSNESAFEEDYIDTSSEESVEVSDYTEADEEDDGIDTEDDEGIDTEEDYEDDEGIDTEDEDDYDGIEDEDDEGIDTEDEDDYDGIEDEDDYDGIEDDEEIDTEEDGIDTEDEDDYDGIEDEDDYDGIEDEDDESDYDDDEGIDTEEDDYDGIEDEDDEGIDIESEPENTIPEPQKVSNPPPISKPEPKSKSSPSIDLNVDDVDIGFSNTTLEDVKVTPESIPKPVVDNVEVDRSSEPTDLRQFIRKHPRCEISFALKYFSKKQINDAIKRGKILQKGNILRI